MHSTKLLVAPESFTTGKVLLLERSTGDERLVATVKLMKVDGENAIAQVLAIHTAGNKVLSTGILADSTIQVNRMQTTYHCRLSEAAEIGERVFNKGMESSVPYPATMYASVRTSGASVADALKAALDNGAFDDRGLS